jgi:hypothetical protein
MRGSTLLLLLLLSVSLAAVPCEQRCISSGNCCTGNTSGCQHPSCQMGCVIGAGSPTVASCNATCLAAKGCSFVFKGTTFQMCGDCSARWVDPTTLQPAILPGGQPFWPPGYGFSSCGSCDETQCQLGCMMAFDPSFAPLPPNPSPPPALPLPPAPWPNAAPGFNFSEAFSDHAVLQRAPALASVFGNTGSADDAGVAVSVTVTPSTGGGTYTVPASVAGGRWRALLKPHADSARAVTFTITATCVGCGASAVVTIADVVFGDVYFCAGQSSACVCVCAVECLSQDPSL